MSITRQQLADKFRDIWHELPDESPDEARLRQVDAAIAALDAADKIAPELPEGWFDASTPRPAKAAIAVAYFRGEVRFHWSSFEGTWHDSWQFWQPIVLPAHPSQHQENPQ